MLLGREPNATSKGKRCMAGSMDTLGIEPRASRMLSGCDTTTPRALLVIFGVLNASGQGYPRRKAALTGHIHMYLGAVINGSLSDGERPPAGARG